MAESSKSGLLWAACECLCKQSWGQQRLWWSASWSPAPLQTQYTLLMSAVENQCYRHTHIGRFSSWHTDVIVYTASMSHTCLNIWEDGVWMWGPQVLKHRRMYCRQMEAGCDHIFILFCNAKIYLLSWESDIWSICKFFILRFSWKLKNFFGILP